MSAWSSVGSRLVDGALHFFSKVNGADILVLDGTLERTVDPDACYAARFHVATADVNAGLVLLPALPGYKYRLVHAAAIAIGGSAATVTTVDLQGTQSTVQKLVAFAQASLTRSTVLVAGASGAAVLADGASYTACDANTPIAVGITGSNLGTSTFIDFIIQYAIEAA